MLPPASVIMKPAMIVNSVIPVTTSNAPIKSNRLNTTGKMFGIYSTNTRDEISAIKQQLARIVLK